MREQLSNRQCTAASMEVDVSSVIVGGARTPIGKLLGGFKYASATDLGGYTMAAASERSGVALIITVPADGNAG